MAHGTAICPTCQTTVYAYERVTRREAAERMLDVRTCYRCARYPDPVTAEIATLIQVALAKKRAAKPRMAYRDGVWITPPTTIGTAI